MTPFQTLVSHIVAGRSAWAKTTAAKMERPGMTTEDWLGMAEWIARARVAR